MRGDDVRPVVRGPRGGFCAPGGRIENLVIENQVPAPPRGSPYVDVLVRQLPQFLWACLVKEVTAQSGLLLTGLHNEVVPASVDHGGAQSLGWVGSAVEAPGLTPLGSRCGARAGGGVA